MKSHNAGTVKVDIEHERLGSASTSRGLTSVK